MIMCVQRARRRNNYACTTNKTERGKTRQNMERIHAHTYKKIVWLLAIILRPIPFFSSFKFEQIYELIHREHTYED